MVGWEQVLIIIGTNITVVAGIFFWLRADIKRLEDKVDAGFQAVDDRLRIVETEQARMAGLLEGLGLSGKLPASES